MTLTWPVPRHHRSWRRPRRHVFRRRAWIQACGRRSSLLRSLYPPSRAVSLLSLSPPPPARPTVARASSVGCHTLHRSRSPPPSPTRRSPPSLPHPLPQPPSSPQSSFHAHRRRGRPLLLPGVPVGRRAAGIRVRRLPRPTPHRLPRLPVTPPTPSDATPSLWEPSQVFFSLVFLIELV